jgi:hypothetical protein
VELRTFLVIVLTWILGAKVNAEGIRKTCTYQTFKWNVNLRGAVGHKMIRKITYYSENLPTPLFAKEG